MQHALATAPLVAAVALGSFAALHDAATRTVPDWVSVGLVLCGVGLRLLSGDPLRGLIFACLVLAGGSVLWLRGYVGGADVKLAAAAALVLPPDAVVRFLLSMSIAGGVLAMLYLLLSCLVRRPAPGRPSGFLARCRKAEAWRISRRGPLPYAAAIAVGLIVNLTAV